MLCQKLLMCVECLCFCAIPMLTVNDSEIKRPISQYPVLTRGLSYSETLIVRILPCFSVDLIHSISVI